jgi:RNA polymerase subunit RPABC4/transcription elongation factor Spt4
MNAKSIYEFLCICGEKILTPDRTTTCPKCGRILVTEWGCPQ